MVDGKARSRIGNTNIKHSALVKSRRRIIRSVVEEYQPRIVLVDHQPQGKSDELIDAIGCTSDTIWILGVRGVVGQVEDVWSRRAADIFAEHYKALFWYGDDSILGRKPLDELRNHFGVVPRVAGYVSRLKEVRHWQKAPAPRGNGYAGTIAIPWDTDTSTSVVKDIAVAMERIGDQYGPWELFLSNGADQFEHLTYCNAQKPGTRYLSTLPKSKVAIIYGGYNSITDVLVTCIPAVVLLRGMDDREQQKHLARLADRQRSALIVIDEKDVNPGLLASTLKELVETKPPDNSDLMLGGAESAARMISSFLDG